MDLAKLQSQLQADFDLRIKDITPLLGGTVNQTFLFTTSMGEFVAKIANKRNAFPVEMWVYNHFQSIGIPSPKIIAYKEQTSTGYPSLLMTKVLGNPINRSQLSEKDEAAIYTELGHIMREIHSIEVSGFGFPRVQHDKFLGESQTWSAFWQQLWNWDEMDDLKTENLVTDREYGLIRKNFEDLAKIEIPEAVLVYNDLHGAHVFTDGKKVTGIIDAGNCIAGDPRLDISMSHFFQNPLQQEAFDKGYGRLTQDPLIKKYLLHIAASKLSMRYIRGDKTSIERARIRLREILKEA